MLHPELLLPVAPDWLGGDVGCEPVDDSQSLTTAFTEDVVSRIGQYESAEASSWCSTSSTCGYPRRRSRSRCFHLWRTRETASTSTTPGPPSRTEVEATGLQHEFQALGRGTAALFFGRYVLHQAAEGPGFVKCPQGSMETRYLVLAPRGSLHRFSAGHQGAAAQSGLSTTADATNRRYRSSSSSRARSHQG
ncbi:unnamed protein product, partial [Prorocentrum cordatum]